jgi:CRISPR-associated protein Cmr1
MSSRRATVGQPAAISDAAAHFRRKYEVRFLTPMFGGGVTAKEGGGSEKPFDPLTSVRGASIRGHLRFWWRATVGCYYPTVSAMRDAEINLWGGPEQQGKVALAVTRQPAKPTGVPVYSWVANQNNRFNPRSVNIEGQDLAYATFPLQARQHPAPHGELWSFGSSSCEIELLATSLLSETEQQQVEIAVKAWLVCGGLGGRTRRGFGAIEGGPVGGGIFGWREFTKDAARFATGDPLSSVPALYLGGDYCQRSTSPTAVAAWGKGISALRDYRQGLNIGRNAEGRAPKRSRWPEADMIRRLTGERSAAHSEDISHVNVAARAGFGMPMIIKFKDDMRGDPKQAQILPVLPIRDGHSPDRLASPFLIRPLRLGESQFVAVCICLQYTVPIEKVRVVQGSRTWEVAGKFGAAPDVSRDRAHPLIPEHNNGDVAQSFLKHFSKY